LQQADHAEMGENALGPRLPAKAGRGRCRVRCGLVAGTPFSFTAQALFQLPIAIASRSNRDTPALPCRSAGFVR
jgi:hypothetical protein